MKRASIPINTRCWVYILLDTETKKQQIEYTINLSGKLHHSPNTALIYYRLFDNVLDALAHKLLLEELSPQSVESIIRKTNPDFQNLGASLII